jgi:hypothetical protein
MVDGALTLASGLKLRGGELLAPTLAGWQRFLEVAPASGLKFGELREAGAAYWARKFPRGLLGTQGAAETEADGEADGAAKTAEPRPPASTRSRPRSCKPSSTATTSAPGRTARRRRSIAGCSTTSCSSAPR